MIIIGVWGRKERKRCQIPNGNKHYDTALGFSDENFEFISNNFKI